jgi:hypothetical protein
MNKCSLGTEHEKDSYARHCDAGTVLFACIPRLNKIKDEHPKRRVRQDASDQLYNLQRQRNR